jgi:serine protease Do
MSDQNTNLLKRHRRTLAMGTAAAVVLLGLSAFAFVPGVRPVSNSEPAPRIMAAADPVARSTPPRMLENGAPFSFADLVERVSPAVVTITAETVDTSGAGAGPDGLPPQLRDFFNQYGQGQGGAQPRAPRKAISAGSGFIIDRAGFVVTNNHVIENSRKITVKLPDGRSFDAKLVGTDPLTDIALLKIKSDKALPTVEFGDDRQVRSATGSSRSAIRSASPTRSRPASSPRSAARSAAAPITTSSRSTRRSTAAIPAARPSTCAARSSA